MKKFRRNGKSYKTIKGFMWDMSKNQLRQFVRKAIFALKAGRLTDDEEVDIFCEACFLYQWKHMTTPCLWKAISTRYAHALNTYKGA